MDQRMFPDDLSKALAWLFALWTFIILVTGASLGALLVWLLTR